MSKWRIIWPISAVAILAAVAMVVAMKQRFENANQVITSCTYQIGEDLISHASSPQLTGLPPGLAGQLSNLTGSPTHVAAVLLGDEPPPVGDGSACSRVILTNLLAKGLELRLCTASAPGKFRIMGYWPTSKHPPTQ